MELTGISIGGGKMEVVELNGFPLRLIWTLSSTSRRP